MKLAIIIVTYQGESYLDGLFATLKQHTDLTDVEIVVVDNASTDGTVAALNRLAQTWPNLHVLAQTRNTGFAEGNNIGLRWARERGFTYAFLLNQDTELTAQWLPPLLRVMETRPDVGAAQPLLVLHSEPGVINSAGNKMHFCGFAFCGDYRRPVDSIPPGVHQVAYATGAALMLRMEALSRSGDFDEKLFMYHEDCDLQIRIRQVGYDCVLVTESTIAHKYRENFYGRKYALLDRNRWLVVLKDWPLLRLLAAGPAMLGTELAVLVFAAKQGWLKEKLRTYGEIITALPATLRDRRAVQKARAANATDGEHLTGAMIFPGLDHWIVTAVANPALTAYWTFVHKVLRVP
jgi:N-acetylglucosaminyl-diphospho-decaprenol L-rhamnosyltransferase